MTENSDIVQVSRREYCIGENRAWLYDEHIICVEVVGQQSTEAALAVYRATRHLEKQIAGKVSYLIDLNKAGKNSPEASRLWKRAAEEKQVYRVAQFGLHPVAKVLASFVNSLTSRRNIQFFNSMEEGLRWIRE